MSRSLRNALLIVGTAAVVVVLFVLLRPDDDDDGGSASTTTAPATTEPVSPGANMPPPPPAGGGPPPAPVRPPQPVLVRIQVRNGRPLGGIARPRVDQGRSVLLHVGADVRDHVHVHGYDLMRDVAPGAPARLSFRATIPGRFEIELEDRRLLIAELTVTP